MNSTSNPATGRVRGLDEGVEITWSVVGQSATPVDFPVINPLKS